MEFNHFKIQKMYLLYKQTGEWIPAEICNCDLTPSCLNFLQNNIPHNLSELHKIYHQGYTAVTK